MVVRSGARAMRPVESVSSERTGDEAREHRPRGKLAGKGLRPMGGRSSWRTDQLRVDEEA